jgi:sensor histidine kinase regulating citrate/malate metabolism
MNDIAKNEIDIIFDSTYDGMIAVNSAGVVTLFNKAAGRITGQKSRRRGLPRHRRPFTSNIRGLCLALSA